MLTKPDIGKRQLETDEDQDAAAALDAGWRIDNDDWWVRRAREGEREIEGNDCSFGEGIVLSPDAEQALAFDKAMAAR